MNKAHRTIASATLLLADGDTDGVCNRAYYAMFDAAHGALLRVNADFNPATTKTHTGLIAAFGEQVMKCGKLSAELGRTLNQVERVRLLADYTGEDVDPERAEWTIDRVENFITAVAAFVS